jgi:asparagine synthase (glutamine-hydrolysing)
MCGISGFVGAYSPDELSAMNDVIAHRGPDDTDSYWDKNDGIGLAHRRLSIIDLSPMGRQPMWDATGRVAIVFNGEIYNYRELGEELRRSGVVFRSSSDTEVIINLYLQDGERCLGRLNGIFAFALWDKERQRLLVARDGVGVKPLYWTETQRGFAFASELKALTRLADFDRTIDPIALSHYLTFLYCPAPRTPFRQTMKLAPGHALLVAGGRIVKQWSFWRLPIGSAMAGKSATELQEQLEVLLAQAVKRQMIADVPVGSFLSGGLDSSALATFARAHARAGKLDCFTIGIRGDGEMDGFPNDLPYARRVAAHLDVPLHVAWTGPEMAAGFERMVYQLDEPQPDPAALHVQQIARLAANRGIKVLLSGAGGDDIFSGYRRHHALRLESWWSWLPRGVRVLLATGSARLRTESVFQRRIARALQYADRSSAERMAGYFAWLAPEMTASLFVPELRAQLSARGAFEPMLHALEQLPTRTTPLSRMLHLEQRFFLADHNLNYTDKMAMAEGVEVRVPFLDPDLMNFAATVPDRFKQHGATGKWLFKRAMERHLPRAVIYRPKTGFGAPLRRWMRHEMKTYFDDALSSRTLKRRGLFDPQAVGNLIELDRTGRIDAVYPLFGLVCIEAWCRHFVDSKPASIPRAI